MQFNETELNILKDIKNAGYSISKITETPNRLDDVDLNLYINLNNKPIGVATEDSYGDNWSYNREINQTLMVFLETLCKKYKKIPFKKTFVTIDTHLLLSLMGSDFLRKKQEKYGI